jgi:hypothetical protein
VPTDTRPLSRVENLLSRPFSGLPIVNSRVGPLTDIWKGNTAYLGGCDDAMSPTKDHHNSTIIHHGYCDPFDYPMDPADRINGWQLNMSTHDQTDLQDAQKAYKEGFELALERLGAVNIPKAVSPKAGAQKPLTYPEDYYCAIADGDGMEGCCPGKDNDMTWDEAEAWNHTWDEGKGWCVLLCLFKLLARSNILTFI